MLPLGKLRQKFLILYGLQEKNIEKWRLTADIDDLTIC
jgi:hypothetical protein